MSGPYEQVGEDYRQLQAPEQVNTDLPDNGAALRAEELSSVFKNFAGLTHDISNEVQTKAGALAGAASGATGHPQYKQGLLRFTQYGQTFNNAATGSYAIEAEEQADTAATRLRVQANNNPDTFQATYSATRDAVLKQAPPLAVPMLTDLYNRHLAETKAAIASDQAVQLQQTQRATYDVGIARDTSSIAYLQGTGKPQDALVAADQFTQLTAKINGGVNAGLYSTAEAQAMLINAHREITAQVFETQVDKALGDPTADVTGMLNNFRQLHMDNLAHPGVDPVTGKPQPPTFSEDEYNKLMMDAKQKVQQQRMIDFYGKGQNKTAQDLKYEAGDAQYSIALFQGNLTDKMLTDAVRSHDITPELARVLHNQLENGPGGKGNTGLLFKLHNSPNVLDMKPSDIARYVGPGGLNGKQADQLSQEIQKRNGSWENTQAVRQAKATLSDALKIPRGVPIESLSDEQQHALATANQEFTQLMNAADPAKRDGSASSIAQQVVKNETRREAEAEVTGITRNRQAFIQAHGPGSSAPGNADDYAARLKTYDDQIKQAQARAGAP